MKKYFLIILIAVSTFGYSQSFSFGGILINGETPTINNDTVDKKYCRGDTLKVSIEWTNPGAKEGAISVFINGVVDNTIETLGKGSGISSVPIPYDDSKNSIKIEFAYLGGTREEEVFTILYRSSVKVVGTTFNSGCADPITDPRSKLIELQLQVTPTPPPTSNETFDISYEWSFTSTIKEGNRDYLHNSTDVTSTGVLSISHNDYMYTSLSANGSNLGTSADNDGTLYIKNNKCRLPIRYKFSDCGGESRCF